MGHFMASDFSHGVSNSQAQHKKNGKMKKNKSCVGLTQKKVS